MSNVSRDIPQARRSVRRQSVFACLLAAYFALFAAAALGLASLAVPTGAAALSALALAGALLAGAAALWAVETAQARSRALAPVAQLVPRHTAMVSGQRHVAHR